MQVLSSLSSIPFYAPSAGYAPTNSADVSAIASAYAESAASSKLDNTASSSFYPADNPSGFISGVDLSDYATTAYVDSSVSSKLDATASSQFLTAVPSDYATTAYVDSSVSSKLDSTASSQFLTSTAGLVGTGDLTAYAYESSNSAKLDTTAFSDVSGTFLTAVPAGYATTADISGFAYESAVSGWTAKQDALTFGYDTANNISSIDGSAIGGQGGGGGIDSATCSAIASAYAESAASSKQDTLTFGYDASNNISSIDGSAIGGQGGGVGAEYSGIAPIHVDNDTHEISADVVNMDLQQITHDDTMVHVSNSASYALGVNYNYSGAPWNEGLILKSGLLYSSNNPSTGVTSYALSDNVSSYYKLDVNFYDINDWHTRMECWIPSGILPSGARGGFFNAVANLPNNVWFKCFRWSAIGTNWYCQVDEIAGTQGTYTPTFNVNQNANPPKVLSIIGWYKDII